MSRPAPNILVTGTPGTGKTSFAEALAEATGYRNINVGALVKEKGYHAGTDTEYDCVILDEDSEDRLLDDLETMLAGGGVIVDFHSCELFPQRWFDLVLVLRTDNKLLYDRLAARGYSQAKITENLECEIMQVCLDEARSSYAPEIVIELPSNSVEDVDSNVSRTAAWLTAWLASKK